MPETFLQHLSATLKTIESDDLCKQERLITTSQTSEIQIVDPDGGNRKMINLCANNYLGLANHPALITAAKTAMDTYGYGMASVRFICGTHDLHRQLEKMLAHFLNKDDSILFAACFDANGGLFEPLLDSNDAIISDALNHASIIDGIRLCKAKRYRYANADMNDLEDKLKAARTNGARFILIATDGVFSMDGYLANLTEITRLAQKYDAMVMVDDCHATGFMGVKGAGTPSHFGVNVDILTGTLGKALGGALGGYIAGPQVVIDILRQRARPYLFSNALPPSIVAAGIAALHLVKDGDNLRTKLFANTAHMRAGLQELGFDLLAGEHPIIPIMLGDAQIAQKLAKRLDTLGVFVSPFFFPVVPKGRARIRTQMSAALSSTQIDFALTSFATAGRELGITA